MEGKLADRWFKAFMEVVQRHEAANTLKDAALKLQLGKWTQELTAVAAATCSDLGWRAAAKKHRSDLLPVTREEYLSLDLVAFEASGDRRWRFPLAVFEFENSSSDQTVAYSLWKVMCVRAALRVVFFYRRDASQGALLVRHLADEVVQSLGIAGRSTLGGETLLIVGSRSESETFPYGFFKDWSLDSNTARFCRA